MNLIDVIKSGKPFRKKGQCLWNQRYDMSECYFSYDDVMYPDYEIQELEGLNDLTRTAVLETIRSEVKDPILAEKIAKKLLERK